MAFQPSYNSRILIGSLSFSAYVNDVQLPVSTAMLDVTTLVDPATGLSAKAKLFIPGQTTSTAALKGFLDPDTTSLGQFDQLNTFTSTQPLTYGPSGLALGAETILVNALKTNATTHSAVAGAVEFALDCQTTLQTDFGHSLHDLTAETVDVSSTGYDQTVVSTANGGVANLHVTAFSGFSGVVFTIEDSANNSAFAVIGTHTTVIGLTSERLTIAGTVRRYVRVTADVTGSGSVTFHSSFARR